MARTIIRTWSIWLLKTNLIIWIINFLIVVILAFSSSTLTNLVSSSYFSKITLAETGIIFLIGGAIAFSGSVLPSKAREHILKSDEKWSVDKLKKSEKSANKFIALALILFLQSIIISLFGF